MWAFADRPTRSSNGIIDNDTREGLDTTTVPKKTSGESEVDSPPDKHRGCEFIEIHPDVCAWTTMSWVSYG